MSKILGTSFSVCKSGLSDILYRKDTLRNEGLSLEFATILFQAWMTNERGIAHISSSLRKVHMENRLLV